jgi:hypothetical protein
MGKSGFYRFATDGHGHATATAATARQFGAIDGYSKAVVILRINPPV